MAPETGLDGLQNLEELRLRLEKNVVELRGLLQQWQTWEAEYEAIKKGLTSLKDDPTRSSLVRAVLPNSASIH